MDTKKVIETISTQANVNNMKKELNDLKLLFNSLETKICNFKQELKSDKDLLNTLKEEFEKALSSAKTNARAEYAEIKTGQLQEQEKALLNLNEAINSYKKEDKRLFGSDAELKRLEAKKDYYQNQYNKISIDIENNKKQFEGEMSALDSDVINGNIEVNNKQIFAREELCKLDELLKTIIDLEKQVNELEDKIEDSIIERDQIVKEISALNTRVTTALVDREFCKIAIEHTTEKTINNTKQVAQKATTEIGKGLKVASKFGKVAYRRAKRKANSFLENLEQDNTIQNEEPTITSQAKNKTTSEQQNPYDVVEGYMDNIANAVGLDSETAEKGKQLVKNFFDKFNNDNKE